MGENADTVTLANAGVGAASQLCGLLIEEAIGVDLTEVPYDGTGPALTDLVGGQVDFMCDQTTNTTGQIQSGDIKAYAVTTPGAVEALPDLPTTAEAGLPERRGRRVARALRPGRHPRRDRREAHRRPGGRARPTRTSSTRWPSSAPPRSPRTRRRPDAHTAKLEEQIDLLDADHRGSRGHRRMSTTPAAPGDHAGRLGGGRSGPSLPDLLAGATFVVLGLAFAIGGARYDVGSALRWAPATSR